MQNVILTPVQEKLVALIEEGRKSSRLNPYFGRTGIAIGAFGLAVYFVDPLGKDDLIQSISTDVDNMSTSFSGLTSYVGIDRAMSLFAVKSSAVSSDGLPFGP